MNSVLRPAVSVCVASGALLLAGSLLASDAVDPVEATAEVMPLASQSLLLNLADGPSRAIAVGERGHILVSESRRDWRQVADVPTRSTLTAVTTHGSQAWAVGHESVILRSGDGGITWERTHWSEGCRVLGEGAAEASDMECLGPLLDVLFIDDDRGFAIGAYGLFLASQDGGRSWQAQEMEVTDEDDLGDYEFDATVGGFDSQESGNDEDMADGESSDDEFADDGWELASDDFDMSAGIEMHLNAITRAPDGALVIVGEAGAAWRSRDEGVTWASIDVPYQGSMFGVLSLGVDHVLAFGMRGNIFESRDLGDSWTLQDTGSELSLMGGWALPEGGAIVVGANGVVLTRRTAEQPFVVQTYSDGGTLAAVLAQTPTDLVLVGENGVKNWAAR